MTGKQLAFRLCFDGAAFYGSQRQPDRLSVQESLEKALKLLFKQKLQVGALSRTDAGVHSYDSWFFLKNAGDFFEGKSEREIGKFFISLNVLLGQSAQIKELGLLKNQFSARDDVLWKEYRYLVFRARHRDPLLEDRSWWIRGELDIPKIQREIKMFKGKHDFAGFAKSSAKDRQSTRTGSVREVFKSDVRVQPHPFIESAQILEFRFRASGFLHHMVRNLVGSLVELGQGKDLNLSRALKEAKREFAGRSAPAQGLFLYKTQIRRGLYAPLYPPKIQ